MRRVILIIGMTGSGKSVLTKLLIQKFNRVIIVDPGDEYEANETFYNFPECLDYFSDLPREFVVACRFDSENELNALYRMVYNVGNILLVVEDVTQYLESTDRNKDFDKLISFGRHRQIHLIGISQRLVELSRKYRGQVTSLFTFRQQDPHDLDVMEKYGGEFSADTIKNLEMLNYNVSPVPVEGKNYLVMSGEKFEQVTFPIKQLQGVREIQE